MNHRYLVIQRLNCRLLKNTSGNTGIGDPVAAVDPESDALIYSLVGADASWFEIDMSSGQVKTKAVLDL